MSRVGLFGQISEINDHLFLSGAGVLRPEKLKQKGITCVINATVEEPTANLPGIDCLRIRIEDSPFARLDHYFDQTADKIKSVKERGGNTLVHCVAGVSRSASLCIAYWLKYMSLGTALVAGYAFYIDRKRRLDPEYKQKIRQNRKLKQANFYYAKMSGGTEFPDPSDPQANEAFFFNQITLGEEKMQTGHIEEGITHLSNAIVTCSKPEELLRIFQQTIPPECFTLLVQAIPGARMRRNTSASYRHGQELANIDSDRIEEDSDNAITKKMFVLQDDELE